MTKIASVLPKTTSKFTVKIYCIVNNKDRAAVAEILKGNPKYMEASLTQGHAHFFSWCGFMVSLGKPKCVPNLKCFASAIV